MAQNIMEPIPIKESTLLPFDVSPSILQDISNLELQFQKLWISSPASFETYLAVVNEVIQAHKSARMSRTQTVYESTSLFSQHVQYLTSFNPDFHLDDSYLQVNHPERVEGIFSRRFAQLPIVGENSPLNMDPLNWRYMYRPNRPFHFITNESLRRSIPKLPPRPWLERERKKKVPTAYYLEQMEMMNALPPPMPEEEFVESAPTPGPLKVLVEYLCMLFLTFVWAMLMLVTLLVVAVETVVRKVVRFYQEKGGLPIETVYVALATCVLVKFLPGMEGEVKTLREVVKADAPIYVLMIRNPNQWSKFNPF